MSLPNSSPLYPDHIQGDNTTGVQLLQYGDYHCPQCVAAYGVVRSILQRFGDRMQFCYRHFPLLEINPQSRRAAIAAEAAASQGAFWAMHDRLYQNPKALDDASLLEHAIALNLVINPFLQAITDHRYDDRIAWQIEQGKQQGVHLTPAFFINGEHWRGNWRSDLLPTIEALL